MPNRSTVFDWLDGELHDFPDQYARARARQAETFLDEIIEIADDTTNDDTQTEYGPIPNHEWITRSKVRIDSRKWFMGKVAPKKYGDSKQLDITTGGKALTAIVEIIASGPPLASSEKEIDDAL